MRIGGPTGWMHDPDHAGGGLRSRVGLASGPQRPYPPHGEPFPNGIDGIRSAGNGFVLEDDVVVAAARRRTADAVARASTAGIPALDATGNLPAGIHAASRGELLTRFGATARRSELLLEQLPVALRAMREAGVDAVLVGGSLVSSKPAPNDLDLAWLPNERTTTEGVDRAMMRIVRDAPNVSSHRADRLVLNAPMIDRARPGSTFLEFFQHDRLGRERGVVLISTADDAVGASAAALRDDAARQALRGLRLLLPG